MKIRMLFSLLSLLAASAAPAAAQSTSCQQKHPNWKNYDCERVTQKKIWIGMTEEMLVASQGAPVRTSKVTTAAGTNYAWVYERRIGTAFSGGVCVSGCKTEAFIVRIGPGLHVYAIEEN